MGRGTTGAEAEECLVEGLALLQVLLRFPVRHIHPKEREQLSLSLIALAKSADAEVSVAAAMVDALFMEHVINGVVL